jgi:hypothetical protein
LDRQLAALTGENEGLKGKPVDRERLLGTLHSENERLKTQLEQKQTQVKISNAEVEELKKQMARLNELLKKSMEITRGTREMLPNGGITLDTVPTIAQGYGLLREQELLWAEVEAKAHMEEELWTKDIRLTRSTHVANKTAISWTATWNRWIFRLNVLRV